MISALQPVTVPSLFAPSVMVLDLIAPVMARGHVLERVSVHFTGRPSRLASASTSASSA